MTELDCYWAEGTFVRRDLVAYNKVEELAAETKKVWKSQDVAVDAVLSQIFQLPTPEHKFVYFHSIIYELLRAQPPAFAPVLGRAIRFMYRNIHYMDLELAHRFLDWFAHHLSNFEFRWKWDEW